jgi:hypothetical protein
LDLRAIRQGAPPFLSVATLTSMEEEAARILVIGA